MNLSVCYAEQPRQVGPALLTFPDSPSPCLWSAPWAWGDLRGWGPALWLPAGSGPGGCPARGGRGGTGGGGQGECFPSPGTEGWPILPREAASLWAKSSVPFGLELTTASTLQALFVCPQTPVDGVWNSDLGVPSVSCWEFDWNCIVMSLWYTHDLPWGEWYPREGSVHGLTPRPVSVI